MIHDRLRLDIAVSEGREIYSWHGENRFSSSTIAEVVGNGPISSGNFVGFLHNIFLVEGIQFKYSGASDVQGVTTFRFQYVVPVDRSGYHVKATRTSKVVPFHGSFHGQCGLSVDQLAGRSRTPFPPIRISASAAH